ncbi:MAG: acyl-CoA thioesterase II [Myxococcota bacterium]|nr:acyl-CoA thioesterase II [Myxococcota bacterium]
MPADEPLAQLLDQLGLETLGGDRFRGASPPRPNGRIFGGLVLAQGMRAAFSTVEDRMAHSLHAYFLRPGDPQQPIDYAIDRIRDGRSFTTRRIVANQGDRPILNMAISFMVEEAGFEHQLDIEIPTTIEGEQYEDGLRRGLRARGIELPGDEPPLQPVEIRSSEPLRIFDEERYEPTMHTWLRTRGTLPDDPALHQCILAYASDLSVMVPTIHPHDVGLVSPGVHSASLDHAMWFHRPLRIDEWHYCRHESPVSANARGFGIVTFYTRAGVLVASCTQEGLIRQDSRHANVAPSDERRAS